MDCPGTPRFARPSSAGGFPQTAEAVSANDTRIGLQMLLSEARLYHNNPRNESKRRPTTAARSVYGGSTCGSSCDGYLSSAGARSVDGPEDCIDRSPERSPPSTFQATGDCAVNDGGQSDTNMDGLVSASASVSDGTDGNSELDDDDGYDAWADLQGQIENAWRGPGEASHVTRYNRLKSYLTWMFIWDPTRDWSEFEEVSAAASLEWITRRQVARLNALPPGKLFLEPAVHAE